MKHTLKTLAALLLLPAGPFLLASCAGTGSTSSASMAGGGGIKPYPLSTCIVTGNGLGSMGDEQRIVHNGREIKFCCGPCVGKFRQNPDKYLAKLP